MQRITRHLVLGMVGWSGADSGTGRRQPAMCPNLGNLSRTTLGCLPSASHFASCTKAVAFGGVVSLRSS
ncbi:protein of unknown function [Thauera humireducens]|nr:protein of unknown function [Thauera humireducens]